MNNRKMQRLRVVQITARLRRGLASLAAGILAATAVVAEPAAPEDWPNYGRDGSEQHYSPLADINIETIDRLGLAWHFELEPGFTVSTPVAADGRLFITTSHSHIRAFDAASGELLWSYDPKVRELAQNALHMSWGNKGIAYWNGRVFLATTDGRVIALDATDGRPVWEQRQFALEEVRNSNGPPRVFDGKVIIGHGGADITPLRGYVTAYDAMTGEQVWRFHTVPGDPALPLTDKAEAVMRPTWLGDWYGKGGGGTAWNAFSHDEELGLIYLGVGNGFPYNHRLRSPGGGDNLFLASIVAVKAETGEYVWHYQVCPAEQWDCTAVQDMTIATLPIDGKPRKVLMQAPKNGFFYVLDAATGEFISAEKVAKVTWAERIDASGRPVENPGIRFEPGSELFELWPGPQGAHSWLPQAFSPRTGLVYLPLLEMGALIGAPEPGATGFTAAMGVTLIPDAPLPDSRRSFLKAWDPVTQQLRWQHELPGVWPGGLLATAGDLLFQGRMDGQFIAYHADSGKPLWSFPTPSPVVAAPMAFGVNGRQYVAVLTGSGSQGGGIMASGNAPYRTDYRLPRHLLVFTLDGEETLPPFTPPPQVPPADSDFRPEPRLIEAGGMGYATNACLVCHGMEAIGGGAAPDLRYSPITFDAAAFRAVVKDGVLKLNGMPPSPQLSDAELEAIRHYLRWRAHELVQASAPANEKSLPSAPALRPVPGS